MIYVIRDTLSGHVKIGFSTAPWTRFSKMRTDCPGELSMRAILHGSITDERGLHQRFAAHRVRGEWFRADGPLAEWLLQLPIAVREAGNYRNTWGDSGLMDDAVAEAVGASRAQVSRVRNGKTLPSFALALKISEVTGVTMESMAGPQPRREAA